MGPGYSLCVGHECFINVNFLIWTRLLSSCKRAFLKHARDSQGGI